MRFLIEVPRLQVFPLQVKHPGRKFLTFRRIVILPAKIMRD
jgi:hypothetical protein